MSYLLLALALLVGVASPARRGGVPTARTSGAQRIVRILPVAAGGAAVLFLIAGRVSIVFAVIAAASTAAYLLDEARRAQRSRSIEVVTTTILGLVVADLRAGALVGQAFARAASAVPDSAPAELHRCFSTLAQHISRGAPGHKVLITVPELTGLSRIWELAETHGLPAAPLLEQARARLTVRARHRSATAASLQGPQATAVILSALPLAGIALGSGMGANPLGLLLSGGLGGTLLVTGVSLICGGLLVSRALIARASS